MANYGAMLRPSALAGSARAHVRSARRALSKFARPQSFSIPPNPSSAFARAKRNLSYFRIHYAILLWITLLLSLAPHRKASMLFLMAAAKVALFYEVILKATPNWSLLHRILDRRLVMALFLIVVVVELSVTRAIEQLMIALSVGVPLLLVHAVFRVGDDLFGSEDAVESNFTPIAEKKDADLESASR